MLPRLRWLYILALGFLLGPWAGIHAEPYQDLPNPDRLQPVEADLSTPVLPPGWRFRPIHANGDYPTGQPDIDVTVDPVAGTVQESYREGDVEVREPLVLTPDEYNQILSGRTVRRLWKDKAKSTRSMDRGQLRSGTALRVELPVQLPKMVRSIVGDGTPNIEISGSETITLSGTSDWTASNRIQTERKNQSAFPSFDMKQELNVNLTGSIGDRIKVDIDQSSNVTTSIDNQVKLRYEGGDDDMIRSVELGNTNLSVEGASFRQEGLFGIKSVARLGSVDVQAIASKQEGKTETARFTPSGELKDVQIRDLEYIHRTYFFIADHPVKIKAGTLHVYKDDRITATNTTESPGLARVNPLAPPDSASNPEFPGKFTSLTLDDDYSIIYPYVTGEAGEIPVIKLRQALGSTEILAVSYVDEITGQQVGTTENTQFAAENPALAKPANTLLLKAIGVEFNRITKDPDTGLFSRSDPWYPVLPYELRNFYDLQGRDIAFETLTLKVKRLQNGAVNDPDFINTIDGDVPLVQILGLDTKNNSTNADGADGQVDSRLIDPQTGILFFPDLHPFNPDTTKICSLVDSTGGFLCLDDFGRNKLLDPALTNPKVYYALQPDPNADTRYYIEAEFKSSTQGFFLGRFDILEGSETVKVDGIPQRRGSDYTIDYQTGQVNFLKPPGPNQTISVDYSFAPGVGSTQLTLLGASASYNPGPNLALTSSVLYDSRGAMETNAKLGEEPAKTVIGDLSSLVVFKPVWMTQLANIIPGVKTNAPSLLNIQARTAVSMPNPNTAGEAYIDDMEGNRESNTIGLSRTQWFWSSTPIADLGDSSTATSVPITSQVATHTLLEWYNARGVKEHDLKPILKNEEGGDAERTVLEMNLHPPTGQASIAPDDWTGVTQSLSTAGQDFSRLKYMEIWVNDFTQEHALTPGKLHIDFGGVSEDAFWNPDSIPNGVLDTEDINGDGKLDRGETADVPFEDTGLDHLRDPQEPGYDPVTNPDPNHDDYHFESGAKILDYSQINGTEGNGEGVQNARPDTEDLNRDGFPQFQNNYFSATIDLSDSTYVAVDVAHDYAGQSFPDGNQIALDNGWRMFRVPLIPEIFKRVGAADWQNVQHIRIWVNGVSSSTAAEVHKYQIGGIELVGNRWLAQAIPPDKEARGLALGVGVRNNKDDSGAPYFYQAPFAVQNTQGGTASRKEQSLALHHFNLVNGDTLIAFKTTSSTNALGWTQYGQIRFWVHGDPNADAQKLRVIARFGADTVNYYEYSAPVPNDSWQNMIVPLDRLSGLKETMEADSMGVRIDTETGAATGEVYKVVGNPSFTRILRISFGTTMVGGPPGPQEGEVWINDLRVSDVHRDRGVHGEASIQANFADVMAMNVNFEKEDEDFFRTGSGVNTGTGQNHTGLNLATTFNLDKILPTSGLQLPVRFSMTHTADVPKFRTGSDVILSDARSGLETKERNQQTIDMSYRRSGTKRGGLARYTLDALQGALTYSRDASRTTSSIDSTWVFRASGNYDLPIGGLPLGLPLIKIGLLPDQLGFNANWEATRDVSYGRQIFEDDDSTTLRSNVNTRILTVGGRTGWTPLSSVRVNFSITSTRDMLLRNEGGLGFNVGTELVQARTLGLNYTPRWLGLFSPNLAMDGTYRESKNPQQRLLTTDPADLKSIANTGNARFTAVIPFARLGQRWSRPGHSGASYFNPMRAVISRFQDIQTTFTYTRGSNISRVTGDAGAAFKTGFTGAIDPDMVRQSNSTFAQTSSYTSGANTTFRPTSFITIDARADHRLAFSDVGLGGSRRTLSYSLPDLKGRWLELHRLLGLSNSISTMSLNSGYNFHRDEAGPKEGPIETRTNTTTWGPLLGWDLAWRNGLRANIATNVTQSTQIDQRVYDLTSDRQLVNTDVRFTKTYSAARGIRFPFSKKPLRLPNDLNLNLTFSAASERKVTKRPSLGVADIVEIDQSRWTIGSATNYNFTQTISGGFNLGFRNQSDRKTNITTRGLTIALNGQFRF
ncbi:MAG TPA: cell surface protein SprA [Candidatus Eisenbacteria bacterium]|nr:cell surface protein SprA [Candidatus Eisenbacteria bacterium]